MVEGSGIGTIDNTPVASLNVHRRPAVAQVQTSLVSVNGVPLSIVIVNDDP